MYKTGVTTDVRVFPKIVYFESCFKDYEKELCNLLRQKAQCSSTEISASCSQKMRSSVIYCYAKNPYSQVIKEYIVQFCYIQMAFLLKS